MKKLNNIIGITGLAICVGWMLIGNLRSAKGDQRIPPAAPAAVVLTGSPLYDQESGADVGWVVDVSTSSPGAPVFKHGDNLASALAVLRSEGFQITSYAFLTYTAIR